MAGETKLAPWYMAVRPFSPALGDARTKYVAWSGLTQLKAVVSLDSSLCPCVIERLQAED